MLKSIAVIMVMVGITLGILYFAVGSTALTVGLGTILLTAILLGAFWVGKWDTHKTYQMGVSATLQAIKQDDHNDERMIKLIMKGMDVKPERETLQRPALPVMPKFDDDSSEQPFVIEGLS